MIFGRKVEKVMHCHHSCCFFNHDTNINIVLVLIFFFLPFFFFTSFATMHKEIRPDLPSSHSLESIARVAYCSASVLLGWPRAGQGMCARVCVCDNEDGWSGPIKQMVRHSARTGCM